MNTIATQCNVCLCMGWDVRWRLKVSPSARCWHLLHLKTFQSSVRSPPRYFLPHKGRDDCINPQQCSHRTEHISQHVSALWLLIFFPRPQAFSPHRGWQAGHAQSWGLCPVWSKSFHVSLHLQRVPGLSAAIRKKLITNTNQIFFKKQ